ncbi:hypothetical protein [Azospirillum argentinense]|uniref:hypothetical protein n=1 Tax=Azospirillum argentinense TaxID=2970906 RepID=UPI001184A4B6|nr:hypothetical protein [Azospirillum argentinense]
MKSVNSVRIEQCGHYDPGRTITFAGYVGEKQIAIAKFRLGEQGPFATIIEVEDGYRRQGIATDIYSHASQYFGRDIVPSTALTEDSVRFWEARGVQVPEGATVLPTLADWEALRASSENDLS